MLTNFMSLFLRRQFACEKISYLGSVILSPPLQIPTSRPQIGKFLIQSTPPPGFNGLGLNSGRNGCMRSRSFGCARQCCLRNETNMEFKSYLPGYHMMGNLNDDSNSGTWHAYCGDKALRNGQFHELHSQRTVADAYIGYHTEVVKQKILEHEAIFKSQLYELHRLYRVQRDLMDGLKMIKLEKKTMASETSMSSCSASQKQDAQRQNTSAFWFTCCAKDLQATPNLSTGKYPQSGVVSQCNAESSKDSEVEILDCVPSTSRRKFNLELRADEHVDVEEPKYHSNKALGNPSHATNGHCEYPPSSRTKMFLGRSIDINSGGTGAKLNKGQKTNSYSLNVLGCDSYFQSNQLFPSKLLAQPLPREFIKASQPGLDDSSSRGRNMVEWLHSNMLGSGRSEGQMMTDSQNLMSEKNNLYKKAQSTPFFQSDRIKAEYCKEGSGGILKHSVSGNDFFNRLNNPHQLDKSFSTSNGSWERSGNCMTQNAATSEIHPCFNSKVALPQSLLLSSKSIHQNGFFKEPSLGSGSAHYSTAVSDCFSRSSASFVASAQNRSVNHNGLTSVGEHSMKGIDLNVVSIGCDSHSSIERNDQGCVSVLQWPKSSNGVSITGQNDGPCPSARTLAVPLFGKSHLSKVAASSCRPSVLKVEETDKTGRICGFDMNLSCESEEKDLEIVTASGRNLIDLNMCLTEEDDAELTNSTPCCHQFKTTLRGFDLEAPGEIEEDENIFQIKHLEPGSGSSDDELVNIAAEAILGISSLGKLNLTQTTVINPAETSQNALEWFIDEIAHFILDEDDKLLSNKTGDDTEEIDSVDYFECMTLQLPETKEVDYLPDYPKLPESEEPTGVGLLTTRTRKGQARRGRPRRDFQRDTLPGLTSLARNEVTEDLQTFGGLMRATGHSWPSGITRARPRRGRPRLTPVQPPNPATSPPLYRKTSTTTTTTTTTNTEHINIEGHRSLTNWGKTTRRPRRQRCRTGNASVLRIA